MKFKTQLCTFGISLLALCVALSAVFRHFDREVETSLPTQSENKPLIVIDAGHGGEDGGAVGTNGVLEKDLNLALSRTLADLLRANGYTVEETRTDDRMLYEEKDRDGHKKRGDLNGRLAYMQKYPDCIFISIHMNIYPTANCRGLQVWYSQNDPRSEDLAKALQNGVKTLLQPENDRGVKPANSTIFLLHKAPVPAVLIECGFLSTPDECEKLSTKEYRDALSLAIFRSVSDFLSV